MALEHAPSAGHDLLLGKLLDGRYRIEAVIGQGGMGTIYRAEHVLLRRKVAVKTLHPGAQAGPSAIERFQREAIAAGAVGNEHVVSVTDMGSLQGGSFYVVLEYLEGSDIGRVVLSEGPFAVARTLRVGLQLCQALGAVHRAGIVHRDLKPENLFLTRQQNGTESLKILDFGICKFHELGAPGQKRLTDTATLLGTPHFMAPEQIEAPRTLDHRADLYAVAANLYYMLTGEVPFDASSIPSLLHRICSAPAPDVRERRPDTPELLARVLQRAFLKRPEARYQSADELYAALAAVPVPQEDAQPVLRSSAVRAVTQGVEHAPTLDDRAAARERVEPNATGSRPRRRHRAAWLSLSSIVFSGFIAYLWISSGRAHPAVATRPHVLVPQPAPRSHQLLLPEDESAAPARIPAIVAPTPTVAQEELPKTARRPTVQRSATPVTTQTSLPRTTQQVEAGAPAADLPRPPIAEPEAPAAYVPSQRDIIHVFEPNR